jgi:hypothetical protein
LLLNKIVAREGGRKEEEGRGHSIITQGMGSGIVEDA